MSSKQIIIQTKDTIEGKPRGERYRESLRSAFPASPIYSNDLTDKERLQYFIDNVIRDSEPKSFNGIVNFLPDYSKNIPGNGDVNLIEHNLPSQYMPNIASPDSEGIKPPFTGHIPNPQNRNFGSGLGGIVNFSNTTKKIIKGLRVPGDYEYDRSYEGSDGTQ